MKKQESLDKKVAAGGTHRAKASTSDILGLGRPTRQRRVDPKWREHQKTLLDFRDKLRNRREGLVREASEETPMFSLHIADAGTDAFDRDFALSMASSEQNMLYEVEQALQRLLDGSYGVCEMTGEPIEEERLQAIPWARFTTEAEKELEKDGTIRRARLAPLEHMPKEAAMETTDEADTEEEAPAP